MVCCIYPNVIYFVINNICGNIKLFQLMQHIFKNVSQGHNVAFQEETRFI